MTKKEMKEMEKIKEERRNELSKKFDRFMRDYKNYIKDVEAVSRVASINEEYEKFDGRNLKKEYTDKLLERYESLEILKNLDGAKRTALRIAVLSYDAEDSKDRYYSQQHYNRRFNAIIYNESIWDFNEFKTIIEILKDFGFETVEYISCSTQAMEVINYMIKSGATVKGVSENTDSYKGLVFDITSIDVEYMKSL